MHNPVMNSDNDSERAADVGQQAIAVKAEHARLAAKLRAEAAREERAPSGTERGGLRQRGRVEALRGVAAALESGTF